MTNQLMTLGVEQTPNDLAAYIRAVNDAQILSAEQEQQLARRFRQEEDIDAARTLILSQLRSVVRIARGFSGYGLPLADLIQEGNIGLMKAVKRFDPDHGVRLISFAVHWIKAEIYEYVLHNWRIVRVATTKAQRKLFFNLRKARANIGWMQGDEAQQIADDLDVDVGLVRSMEERLGGNDISFNASQDDDDDVAAFSPESWLGDNRYNPEQLVEANDTSNWNSQVLGGALQELDDRSRDIIARRWLDDENKSTLQELADDYGVSAERIRQLESRALKQLREHMS